MIFTIIGKVILSLLVLVNFDFTTSATSVCTPISTVTIFFLLKYVINKYKIYKNLLNLVIFS